MGLNPGTNVKQLQEWGIGILGVLAPSCVRGLHASYTIFTQASIYKSLLLDSHHVYKLVLSASSPSSVLTMNCPYFLLQS